MGVEVGELHKSGDEFGVIAETQEPLLSDFVSFFWKGITIVIFSGRFQTQSIFFDTSEKRLGILQEIGIGGKIKFRFFVVF